MAGADRKNLRRIVEQADVFQEERQRRVLPVLTVEVGRWLDAGDDVVNPLAKAASSKSRISQEF